MSLRARLLVVGSLALAAFLSLTGLTLDRAFRDSARTALQERLQGYVYLLLAASELSDEGALALPAMLPEPRFATPGSGVYAQVSANGSVWRSQSSVGLSLPEPPLLEQGQFAFEGPVATDVGELYFIHYAIGWENADGTLTAMVFSAAEDLGAFRLQVTSFRRSLWGWLGAAALVLLGIQIALLQWSIRPLTQVADDLRAIERGDRDQLDGPYPRELTGLTSNLNALIRSQQLHLERYRNNLADLAHSLKTPLAVLRSSLEAGRTSDELLEQIERMDERIGWQLKSAATRGGRALSAPLEVSGILERVRETLDRLHADRDIRCELDCEPGVRFRGEEGDFFELAGNLMENAYKWCQGRVLVSCVPGADGDVLLTVSDDGAGIAPDRVSEVLQRGVRGDERAAGHGLGLAIVDEIVRAYDGEITIDRSEMGGAAVRVRLPG